MTLHIPWKFSLAHDLASNFEYLSRGAIYFFNLSWDLTDDLI